MKPHLTPFCEAVWCIHMCDRACSLGQVDRELIRVQTSPNKSASFLSLKILSRIWVIKVHSVHRASEANPIDFFENPNESKIQENASEDRENPSESTRTSESKRIQLNARD